MRNILNWRSLKTRITLLTLVISAASVWTLSFYGERVLLADMQAQLGEQQFSTVTMLAQHIDEGISERRSALETIAAEVTPLMVENPTKLQAYLEQRPLLGLLFNGGVFATDRHGTAVADVPHSSSRIGVNYMDRETVSVPLTEKKTIVGSPAMGKKLQSPIFSIATPLLDASGKVFGVLVGTINLGKPNFLDKITNGRYGNTGGFLLFAPKSNLTVTATDRSRIMQPMPAAGLNVMHDRYMQGFEGFGVAVSSRGIEELSAAKRIPTAGWYLVAALPTSEAFAAVGHTQRRLEWASVAIALVGAALVWVVTQAMLRRQLAPVLSATRKLASEAAAPTLQPLAIARPDEIGELIASFNGLTETLAQREALLNQVLDTASVAIFLVDKAGYVTRANQHMARMFEQPLETIVGCAYVSLIHPSEREVGQRRFLDLINSAIPSIAVDRLYWRKDHTEFYGHLTASRFYSPAGDEIGLLGVIADIHSRKQNEDRLQFAASVFTHAREGITITHADGSILDVNESFTRITGYSREEVLGKNPRILASGRQSRELYAAMWRDLLSQGHWAGELWNRRKNGDIYPETITISAVRDAQGRAKHYVALFSDITPLKEHERKLEHIAHFDALTSLPNRTLLGDRLNQAMAQAQRRGQMLAVVFLDLDGFKSVNDRYGHESGDLLLIAVAARMKEALREGDTLARMGGDEFVAVLLDLPSATDAVAMLTRLLVEASQAIKINDISLQVTASLGVTYFPQSDDVDADQLLRQADQAMYQAKLLGKNRFHVFDAEEDKSVRGHHESLEHIRRALVQNEFVLYYQPKVNMRTGDVIGVEALIRWQHPHRGLLAPMLFLPAIENHPLAVDVGEWVIETALRQIEIWSEEGLNISVSVNVGSRQLLEHDFLNRLQKILEAHPKVSPSLLELEVLETSALEDVGQASQLIESCALLGVNFSLDDFGTGYSSLSYLKRLRVKTIKIDQSFVRDMLDDPDDLTILEGIIGLAASFRREVIAEGVETVEHGKMLLHMGCDLAQGYGIARPMAAELLPRWAVAWEPDSMWR